MARIIGKENEDMTIEEINTVKGYIFPVECARR